MVSSHLSLFFFATLLTSFGYGIAFTLFIKSVGTIMRKRRSTGKLNLPLVVPSVLIFMLATVNVAGIWVNTYRALIVNIENPESYLGLIRTPAKTAIQVGQVGAIILADALVVYRTFIIWNHNYYVIVVPCLTFVATFTAGVSFVNLQHRTNLGTSIFSTSVTQWTVAFLLSSFFTTVYSTALIAFRLLRSQLTLHQHGVSTTGGVSRVLRILVESAALYSLNHLLYAVLYEVKSNVEATPSFLEASVASITCSLIIVRSEKAMKNRPLTETLPTAYVGSGPMSARTKSLAVGRYSKTQEGTVFALHSVEVNVDVSKAVDQPIQPV